MNWCTSNSDPRAAVYTKLAPESHSFRMSGLSGQGPSGYGPPSTQVFPGDSRTVEEQAGTSLAHTDTTPQASRNTSTSSGPLDLRASFVGETPMSYSQLEGNRSSTMTITPASSIPNNVQRSISETMGNNHAGEDSPVMNDTLSVIDEHIHDLSTPRHSLVADQHLNDSGSEYSIPLGQRLSYLAGPETDDEDSSNWTEEEVKQWDANETSEYLRGIGVEPEHCDIFEQQEITGEVLLEMDQAFLYMKEYEFGLMGRRLKTWHKVRAFQKEVKGNNHERKSSSYSGADGSSESLERFERSQSRTGTLLPRIPSLMEKPGPNYRQSRQSSTSQMQSPAIERSQQLAQSPMSATSPLSPWRSIAQDSQSRPSAASVREIHHSRRHSSIDVPSAPSTDSPRSLLSHSTSTFSAHRKQPSFDRNWSMTSAGQSPNGTLGSGFTPASQSLNRITLDTSVNGSSPTIPMASPIDELDRGYFSGGELDNRKARNVLRKRDSTAASFTHSRNSSAALEESKSKGAAATKRHSRFGSADSIRDLVPHFTSPAAKAYHSSSFTGRFRSASSRASDKQSVNDGVSPTVTRLDGPKPAKSVSLLTPSPKADDGSLSGNSSISSLQAKATTKGRRMMGLRAISDAVTGSEKTFVTSPSSIPSPVRESPLQSPVRTESSTPSGEVDNTEASFKGAESQAAVTVPKLAANRRTKSKKETTAYTRGLEKKTPAEQRIGCDHSGWMKKKSSSLITLWKPRLFILRGRRLSYFYSEDDTEEKGVIDISNHKVLVDNDAMTSLHAAITGAAPRSKPSQDGQDAAAAMKDDPKPRGSMTRSKSTVGDTPFYFKLVPPRPGFSRAVQFTKPTVHFFQVDNIVEGRKWMGELMKATIERDISARMESTYKLKTISLAKARGRKERPPALAEDSTPTAVSEAKAGAEDTGLNIRGVSFDDVMGNGDNNESERRKILSLEAPKSTFLERSSSNEAERTSERSDTTTS